MAKSKKKSDPQTQQVRHGDAMLVRVSDLPSGAELDAGNPQVVAVGETDHVHVAVTPAGGTVRRFTRGVETFLELAKGGQLRHLKKATWDQAKALAGKSPVTIDLLDKMGAKPNQGDHDTIPLSPGVYRERLAVEYTPAGNVRQAD